MNYHRRNFIGLSAFALFGISPIISANRLNFQKNNNLLSTDNSDSGVKPGYPTTNTEDMSAVVGAAHTQFDRVKELVTARPELAKASHDWGFGDVESALGAASHMGRKDIAEFLIEYGARPDIFTFAMLGKLDAVKSMIEAMPGIERIKGPHGFTLLFHANMRLRRKNVEGAEKDEQEALVEYLKTLEGANIRPTSLEITNEEREKYLGTYKFGEGPDEYFVVKINGMDRLSLGRAEYTNRVLNMVDENIFAPSGAPSVRIHFDVTEGKAAALTISDPSPIVKAIRG